MERAVVMNLLRPRGPNTSRVGLGLASGSNPLPAHMNFDFKLNAE